MQETECKTDEIFPRLPPPKIADSKSPLQLTDFGKDISDKIDAVNWANRIAGTVQEKVKSKEACNIDGPVAGVVVDQ